MDILIGVGIGLGAVLYIFGMVIANEIVGRNSEREYTAPVLEKMRRGFFIFTWPVWLIVAFGYLIWNAFVYKGEQETR